jgi:uncharacterized protein YkwD
MSRFLVAATALAVAVGLGAAQDKAKDEKKDDKLTLSPEEQKVLDLTNQERARQKLPELKPNPKLFKAARDYSALMAEQEKMGHDIGGKKPRQRAEAAGYDGEYIGENVGEGHDTPRDKHTVEQMVTWWMGSPDHRRNILAKEFTEIGLGAVKGKDGKTYYTQLFGAPFPEDK